MKYKKRAIAAGFAAAALASGAFAGAAAAEDGSHGRREHHRDLTDDQREVIAEIRALRKAGDLAGAAQLAAEAGLPNRPHAEGHRRLRGVGPEARAAVEDDDYGAFADAVEGSRLAERAGEDLDDVFELMVQGRELRNSGDEEGARSKMKAVHDLLRGDEE